MDSALPVVKTKVRSAVSYGRINTVSWMKKVSLWFSVGLRHTLIVHYVFSSDFAISSNFYGTYFILYSGQYFYISKIPYWKKSQ